MIINVRAKLKVDYGKKPGIYYLFQIASSRAEAEKTVSYFKEKNVRILIRKAFDSKYFQLYKKNI